MDRLRTGRAITLSAFALVMLVTLTSCYVLFIDGASDPDGVYVESPTSIHASLGAKATSGPVVLRVNTVGNAATQEVSVTWEQVGLSANNSHIYYTTLVPPADEKYLIANITVTNAEHNPLSFKYTDLYLVGSDKHTYYATYALCGEACSADTLSNHTLDGDTTSTMYILFAASETAQVSSLVYASDPPLVVSLV
ncbi:MAG: DUF4352 domain-containing protein [Euryarchaeota archaeon]|nr:DUF4352 domain-containing protein [Euryarchaeota archaeon]